MLPRPPPSPHPLQILATNLDIKFWRIYYIAGLAECFEGHYFEGFSIYHLILWPTKWRRDIYPNSEVQVDIFKLFVWSDLESEKLRNPVFYQRRLRKKQYCFTLEKLEQNFCQLIFCWSNHLINFFFFLLTCFLSSGSQRNLYIMLESYKKTTLGTRKVKVAEWILQQDVYTAGTCMGIIQHVCCFNLICVVSETHESLDKLQEGVSGEVETLQGCEAVNSKRQGNSQYITLSCRAFYLSLFICGRSEAGEGQVGSWIQKKAGGTTLVCCFRRAV